MTTNFEKLTKQESEFMRIVYSRQERKIKKQLESAILKGNDTAHLKSVLKNVQIELKTLDNYFEYFAQQKLPLIYKTKQSDIDNAIKAFDNKFDITTSLGKTDPKVIRTLANNTYLNLNQITKQIGRHSEDLIRQIGLEQAQGIVFGSESWQSVAKGMTEQLKANDFAHVVYKNGTKMPASAYSKMVARTTSAEAYRRGTRERIKEYGFDLVDIIGRSTDDDSPCLPYEGKTLSLSGKTAGYTPLGEATANGLFHVSCIHTEVFSSENKKFV